jgi:hypothetical protein
MHFGGSKRLDLTYSIHDNIHISIWLGRFVPSKCNVVYYCFFAFLYWTRLSRPDWLSSCVQDSVAYCKAVLFPPIVIASGYFGYVGYHQFYLGGLNLVAFGFVWFVGCGCFECSCWGGCWSAIIVVRCGYISVTCVNNSASNMREIRLT